MISKVKKAKPFLKWAGGKTQLLNKIEENLPTDRLEESFTYIEPFVGSGALLFRILQTYPSIKKAIINDLNEDLTNVYLVIKQQCEALILALKKLEAAYNENEISQSNRLELYKTIRQQFNSRTAQKIDQAAMFIFLNRTCFNGLYRVNRKNEFNVPMGRYKRPLICDEENLRMVAGLLQKVAIYTGDYREVLKGISPESFVYFDPPYKPISASASFNAYTNEYFGDEAQKTLAEQCRDLDNKGVSWMLSNSDPQINAADFFADLYKDFYLQKVQARRAINANSEKRGPISELLITNYEPIKKPH